MPLLQPLEYPILKTHMKGDLLRLILWLGFDLKLNSDGLFLPSREVGVKPTSGAGAEDNAAVGMTVLVVNKCNLSSDRDREKERAEISRPSVAP